jgi:hypothetical protein
MPQNFLGCDRDQSLLLPPDLRDWLDEDHLAWFGIEAIEELDLESYRHRPAGRMGAVERNVHVAAQAVLTRLLAGLARASRRRSLAGRRAEAGGLAEQVPAQRTRCLRGRGARRCGRGGKGGSGDHKRAHQTRIEVRELVLVLRVNLWVMVAPGCASTDRAGTVRGLIASA